MGGSRCLSRALPADLVTYGLAMSACEQLGFHWGV